MTAARPAEALSSVGCRGAADVPRGHSGELGGAAHAGRGHPALSALAAPLALVELCPGELEGGLSGSDAACAPAILPPTAAAAIATGLPTLAPEPPV